MEGQRERSILCDLIYYNLTRFSAGGETQIALSSFAKRYKSDLLVNHMSSIEAKDVTSCQTYVASQPVLLVDSIQRLVEFWAILLMVWLMMVGVCYYVLLAAGMVDLP